MGYAYSNDGLSWRAAESGWALADGEVYFAAHPNGAALSAAFPGNAAAVGASAARTIAAECRRRIVARVSEDTQRNLTAYSSKLTKDVVVLSVVLTNDQKADLATADEIFEWINGASGMLAACRALIIAADADYADDSKWPAWTDAWSVLVAKF